MATQFSSMTEQLRIQKKEWIVAIIFGFCLGVLLLVSPWLGFAAVIGGLLFVAVLNKPIILAYITVLAIIFLSGMSRGQIIPFFIPNEPILAIIAAMAFPIILSRRQRSPSKIGIFTLGWMVFALGTSIFPFFIYLIRGIDLSVKELFLLIAPLQYILLYWLFRYLPTGEKEVRAILRLMFVCAAIVGIIGLLQTARIGLVLDILHTWYKSSHEEAALSAGRISSLLGAWNSLGTFLMLNLIIVRTSINTQPKLMNWKMNLFVILSCLGGLIASGSYASLGGLILGLAMYEFFNKKGRGTAVAILLAMVLLAIPLRENILQRVAFQYRQGGLIPQTLVFRFYVWRDIFWPIIEKSWLWGFRPVLPTTLTWVYPESQYLELLLRSGIISLAAHFLWVGLTLSWLVRGIKLGDNLHHSLSAGVMLLFVVLSVMGITNGVFAFSGVIEYLWILIALIGVLMHKKLEEKHEQPT